MPLPYTNQPAGNRNCRVAVEQNVPTTNTDGQKVENWVRRFDLWVDDIPRTGREARVFEQLRAEIDHVVRGLWSSQVALIQPADWRFRIKSSGQILNIGSIFRVRRQAAAFEAQCMEIVV